MRRRAEIYKRRPDWWQDGPELGRHETAFGLVDIVERGRELTSTTLPNGPKPVPMRAKAKYRAS